MDSHKGHHKNHHDAFAATVAYVYFYQKGKAQNKAFVHIFLMCSKYILFPEQSQVNLFTNRPQPKKKRKSRTAFTNHQIFELEKRFLYQKYLSPADRDEIAAALGLSNAQVTAVIYFPIRSCIWLVASFNLSRRKR